MSEELHKDQEIIEKYQYTPDEEDKLIADKPSEPLKKIKKSIKSEIVEPKLEPEDVSTTVSTTVPKTFRNENKIVNISKSNKELYESYIKELKNFCLSINGEIVYDSSIDKFRDNIPVKFENDYFILYGKKYSYNGLKIQKINSNK